MCICVDESAGAFDSVPLRRHCVPEHIVEPNHVPRGEQVGAHLDRWRRRLPYLNVAQGAQLMDYRPVVFSPSVSLLTLDGVDGATLVERHFS
jgi:hypothetical protein